MAKYTAHRPIYGNNTQENYFKSDKILYPLLTLDNIYPALPLPMKKLDYEAVFTHLTDILDVRFPKGPIRACGNQ